MMDKKTLCALLCLVLGPTLLTSCGASQEQDPVAVVQAFYEAANAEDIEAFMALVTDDAQIEWGREGLVTGKESIRSKAEALFLDLEFTFMLSDFQVDGSRVTFNHKMVLDDTQTVMEECADEVIVKDGKIKSARLITCEYPLPAARQRPMTAQDQEITIKRTILTSPSQVYAAFSSAEGWCEWCCETAEVDARVGGNLHIYTEGYHAYGVFTELEQNQALAFTWNGDAEPPVLIRVVLDGQDGTTHLTFRVKGICSEEEWAGISGFLERIWGRVLTNLKAVLEETQGSRCGVTPKER